MLREFLLAVASSLLLVSSDSPPSRFAALEWQPNYEAALVQAAEARKVVFVALDYEGEARCDHFLKKLCRDKEIVALASRTLNVPATLKIHKKKGSCSRFKGVECMEHRRSEAALRESVLGQNSAGVVAIPQYLWIGSSGEVLLSVPYEVERECLLWCFVKALRLVDPENAPPYPEGARPPRRLLMGETYCPPAQDQIGRGLTHGELRQKIKASTSRSDREALVSQLLLTDEPDAIDFTRDQLVGALRLSAHDRVPRTIHSLGSVSPPSYWEVLGEFLKVDEAEIRHEVAVALEQLAALDAAKLARRGLEAEKDEAVRCAWVRALGACAPTDRKVRDKILRLATEEQDQLLCASATIALGYLAPDPVVRKHLIGQLAGTSDSLRQAAACAIALARDESCLEILRTARDRCADGIEKDVLGRALGVLGGANFHSIERDVTRLTGDGIRRERVFFRSPRPSPREGE